MTISHNVILPKYLKIVKKREQNFKNARMGGWGKRFYFFCFFFSLFGPAVRSQKILAVQSGGRKGRGFWGEGIFARLFCAAGAVGWKTFPPFGIKPNIKAKQFSNPFKRKRVARQIQKIERKLFCFARRVSAGGNAGAGFQIIRAIFARNRFELRSVIAT